MMFYTAPSLHATMQKKHFRNRLIALLFGAATLIFAGYASADPPARVARLSHISGAVSFSPAGEDDWVEARINRPLITGDRLWVDAGARAELQVGSSVFRMGSNTSVAVLNLDDRVAQLQVAQGTLNVRVRRLGSRDVVEVDTPNLAYSIRRRGGYRIDVDPADDATTIVVRTGQAEVFGEGAAYLVNAGQSYRFFGTDLRDYDYLEAPRADEFDRWSDDRDRRGDNSASARYVSRDVIGYEDLDEYGSWRPAEGYGNVWVPNRVPAGWAPYRDGHWAWVAPWGWTWVDDAPWGFAVSHYGRWANLGGTWGWVPGPPRERPVYAPALVAFIGGGIFSLTITSGSAGSVGWFPLGPRDVYRPSYPVSRTYFNNVNTSNTTVNNTTITNIYNNTNVTNVTYVNQRVPGAVIAVPATAFAQSHPVAKAAIPVSKEAIAKAPVTPVAAVAPVQTSVHGGAAPAGRRPPAEAQARRVVAKEPPPAAPVPFAAQQRALAVNPGKPLDAAALAAVKPAAPATAPAVKVVSPPTQPAAAPPPKQAAGPGGPRPSEAQKGPQPPEAQKGPPSEAKKGPPSPEAQKGTQPPEAQKAQQPPVSAPQPAVKGPQPPEVQKGPPSEARKGRQSPEAEKAQQPPVSAPQPAVNVPRPPEVQKAPPLPEAQKAPPPVSAPRPPEAPKAPPPEAKKAPQPPEAQKAPLREAKKAPRPPEAQRGPPSDAKKGPDIGDAAIRQAQEQLQGATAALEAGREPLPGERIGTAGGGSRLTDAYSKRIKALEDRVNAAQKRLDDANSRRKSER